MNANTTAYGYHSDFRELCAREGDGLSVSLEYRRLGVESDADLRVHVHDERTGEDFTISDVPAAKAMDVYSHPFAYADRVLLSGRL